MVGCGGAISLISFFFQAEDGIRDLTVTGVQRVLFRSKSSKDAPDRLTKTSRGSSRSVNAPSVSPAGSSAGGSLRLWPAPSMCPSRSASSISPTNRPLPPTAARCASTSRSPSVRIGTTSTSAPSARRRAATARACASASGLPRVPSFIGASSARPLHFVGGPSKAQPGSVPRAPSCCGPPGPVDGVGGGLWVQRGPVPPRPIASSSPASPSRQAPPRSSPAKAEELVDELEPRAARARARGFAQLVDRRVQNLLHDRRREHLDGLARLGRRARQPCQRLPYLADADLL